MNGREEEVALCELLHPGADPSACGIAESGYLHSVTLRLSGWWGTVGCGICPESCSSLGPQTGGDLGAPRLFAPAQRPLPPAPGDSPRGPPRPASPACLPPPQEPRLPLVSHLARQSLFISGRSLRDFSTPRWGVRWPEVRRWRAGTAATCPSAAPPEPASDSATRLSRNTGSGGVGGRGGHQGTAPHLRGRD